MYLIFIRHIHAYRNVCLMLQITSLGREKTDREPSILAYYAPI